MSRAEDLQKVKEVLNDQLAVDSASVSESTSFIRDLACDSLEYLQLTTALESAMHTTFSDEDLQDIRTVADVLDLVEVARSDIGA